MKRTEIVAKLKEHASIVVVVIMFLIICGACLNDQIIYTPDSARYLARGNSLASFEGFLDRTTPEPSKYVFHAPLYSVLLAPSQVFFPHSVVAAKAFTFLLGALMLFLFYKWVLPRTDNRIALAATLMLALNPLTFIYSTQILSDIPFATCFILFLVLAEKLEEDEHRNKSLKWGFMGTVVAVVFIREVGFTIILGVTAYFLWRKKYRPALTIFFVSLFLYFLWYVRNEIVVAGVENPPLRNTKFFFTHLFTNNQATIVEEILARVKTNAAVYAGLFGRLVLFPEFVQRAHSLVSLDDPLINTIIVALRYVRSPLMLAMFGLSAYGLFVERTTRTFPLLVIVLVCYLGAYLTYPTNDIRYLYPFVPILLRALAEGWGELVRRNKQLQTETWRRGALALFLLILAPNTVWMVNAVRNSWMYTISPRVFYEKMDKKERYPEQFGKPLSLAAEWAARHCDSSQLVASSMKETVFWLNGRPVVDINQNTMDQKLRDYNVRYIVSLVSRIGINEFEAAMAKSNLFNFRPVHREGTVEVVEVTRKKHSPLPFSRDPDTRHGAKKDSIRHEFVRGLQILEAGKALEAESLFYRLSEKFGKESEVVFYNGVAKEFAGHLDEAEEVFRSFRLLPQAGSYVLQSSYHLEIISRIRAAESLTRPSEKAKMLNVVAINYWELAFRHRSLTILRHSLEADSTFFPSLVLAALYSLEVQDTVTSKRFLAKSKFIDQSNVLVQSLGLLFQLSDSLRNARLPAERNSYRISMARAYIAMGLREEAIQELLELLDDGPLNEGALRLLAEVYEFKRRYAPALSMVTRLLVLHPHDDGLIRKREDLLARW